VIPIPLEVLSVWVREVDDAWLLPSAVVGGADMLVTGDQDLPLIAAQAPIAIVTPREAWTRLRGG
jgi:predicted nucleic acid-binding protein